ncbi:MAG TPA: hypothetical protein DD723_10280 [Candidatus Omnitrophica bacterium]|uniref:Transcriptional regulator n=1 Tax=Candidatus Kaiserbacteria bacterium GW2011_GWA2_49_19 TaxID=1618669 RepID=A0A0G1VPY7_9BACT|nr:MAG: hypothetical protein UY44_C0011G0006 [Candidatus Kaiserbacteria bacterium GW2011_GWA2_49_19]HBR15904.1 hypothetical protein [Candidatus Omnitrophota bacterium]
MTTYPSHEDQLVALKRIEGQVRGVQKMIEEGRYCVDIMTQLASVCGAIASVRDKILEKHLNGCVREALRGKSEKDKQDKIDEVIDVLRKFRNSP